ncbi:hypothetical protein CPB84DRAFT_1706782 [Gymnopilus junonius]|uniref:Uncharacterized protein n=1 Tax=Gymnopilus junonius TaxID=109634 RepID=A0A9P5NP76_GYMJU|nr:hypothetical protein CPB84DRAFT_1706782 [Gymnopilus junonius]
MRTCPAVTPPISLMMGLELRGIFLLWLLCLNTALGYPGQTVFKSTVPIVKSLTNTTQWDLTAGPPINSASNLIFSSVNSFLQHWPNTRYRNGHNIVPSVIPVGTIIYHGTDKQEIPNHPEWAATDPEHSYVFCRTLKPDSGCWHLTLVATRPLKVLYFDGSSAAKMDDGPMDSQDLVVWGEVKPHWANSEGERITDLCEWGKKYEIDGFLRMEMDFEIMLCDFSNGVQPVSFLNIVPADQGTRRPKRPSSESQPSETSFTQPEIFGTSNGTEEDERRRFPLRIPPLFRVLEAGSWHNHFPGDPRFQPDYSRIVSFYDPVLFPSLHAARLGQGRLEHRLKMISLADVEAFSSHLDAVLKDWQGVPSGSGVDWKGIVRVVIDRYAERLELLHYILNSTSIMSEKDANATLKQAYRHTTGMIVPYTLHSAIPPSKEDRDLSSIESCIWASPIYELCSTTHTDYIENSGLASKLTHSEYVLLGAVKGVSKEICRVLVGLWAEGTEAGLAEPDLTIFDHDGASQPNMPAPIELVKNWKIKVENLMTWLDWSSNWLRCRPECSYEEMCYLPTWPWFARPKPRSIFLRNWLSRFQKDHGVKGDDDTYKKSDLENGEWVDPQPRCVRRLEPLEFKDESGL